MDVASGMQAVNALADRDRLKVCSLLVRTGPAGLSAGQIVRATGIAPDPLSTHLKVLVASGLVGSRRDGPSITYSASYAQMGELLSFLMEEACDGQPELCWAAIERAATGCACEADAAARIDA